MAWVEQIREVEDSLIAIISLDGDIVTEALANLPADARGRLQTMLALAEEAAAMSGVGHHYVIDTGLGPAVYHISSEDEDEPAAVPFFGTLPAQPAAASGDAVLQLTAGPTDAAASAQPSDPAAPLPPISKSKTKGGHAGVQPTSRV